MRRILSKFRNLRYRYKITWLVLAAGLLPVAIIAVYFLSGMIDTVPRAGAGKYVPDRGAVF